MNSPLSVLFTTRVPSCNTIANYERCQNLVCLDCLQEIINLLSLAFCDVFFKQIINKYMIFHGIWCNYTHTFFKTTMEFDVTIHIHFLRLQITLAPRHTNLFSLKNVFIYIKSCYYLYIIYFMVGNWTFDPRFVFWAARRWSILANHFRTMIKRG